MRHSPALAGMMLYDEMYDTGVTGLDVARHVGDDLRRRDLEGGLGESVAYAREELRVLLDQPGHAGVVHLVVQHHPRECRRVPHRRHLAFDPALARLNVAVDVTRQVEVVVTEKDVGELDPVADAGVEDLVARAGLVHALGGHEAGIGRRDGLAAGERPHVVVRHVGHQVDAVVAELRDAGNGAVEVDGDAVAVPHVAGGEGVHILRVLGGLDDLEQAGRLVVSDVEGERKRSDRAGKVAVARDGRTSTARTCRAGGCA